MRYAALLLALTACNPMVSHRGHVAHEAMIESVNPGMSREEVLRAFGSPSSKSAFGAETWYYVQGRKEAHAFFRPEITEQEVVSIQFDSFGQVQEVKDYNLDDRQEVVMVEDITPTEGHSIGFLEQVLGNVGRFNTPTESGGASSRGGRGPGGR